MCALFGAGVRSHQVPLDEDPPAIQAAPVAVEVAIAAAPLLSATLHAGALGTTEAVVHAHALPVLAASSQAYEAFSLQAHLARLAPQPLAARRQDLPDLGLATRVREAPAMPRPRVHRDLDAMREREVLKRAVLPRFLTPAQRAHWQKRIGEAKRVSPRLVDLVGVFPNVAIAGDATVHYRAEQAAIAYRLPAHPVPLTTVVIARHQQTGELLLGRFHPAK